MAIPDIPAPTSPEDQYRQLRYLEDGLFAKNVFAAPYLHGGKWWARFSAQVWNELGDFDIVADVLAQLARDVAQGQHLQQSVDAGDTQDTVADLPKHDE